MQECTVKQHFRKFKRMKFAVIHPAGSSEGISTGLQDFSKLFDLYVFHWMHQQAGFALFSEHRTATSLVSLIGCIFVF